MERSGPSFLEGDDDENDLNPVEADPPQLSFTERLKEIFDLEDDDEEDESGGKKKGLFKRLFSKVPGVVDMDKAEEEPVADDSPERSFSLSFLSAPEISQDEPMVEPHHTEPSVVHPEQTPEDDEDEYDPPVVRQNQPLQQQATMEVADAEPEADEPDETPITVTPAAYMPAPTPSTPRTIPAAEYAAAETTSQPVETDDFATHKEVTRKTTVADAVGVGAAVIANSRAKSREQDLEQRTEERQEKLKKTIEANKQDAEQRLAHLRQQLEEERIQPSPIHRAAERPQPEPQAAKSVEQTTKPQPINETYSPDVHDRIPPKVAFEKLTGMEQPLPRSLEQERRHEVKDDPSKVPVSYTQTHPDPADDQVKSANHQSARSNLMNLNPMASPTNRPSASAQHTNQIYKKAIISGAVTAVVILAIVIALAVFS